MSDALAARYATHVYPTLTQTWAHPRLAAVPARLHGLETADPAAARVLELGCNRGATAAWIARTLPEAEVTGIDLTEAAVAAGRAAHADLANLTLEVADLATWDPGPARFDLILASGMYSWTPAPVRDALLALAARALAPRGVALINWNALPGAATRAAIRRLMLLEEAAGGRFLDVLPRLEQGLADLAREPHAALMEREIARLRAQPEGALRHDEAGAVTEPFHLVDVAAHAGAHGLAWLCDADLALDWPAALPPSVARAVAGLPRLHAAQTADHLMNTAFRRGVFVRAEDAEGLSALPDPRRAAGLTATPLFLDVSEDDDGTELMSLRDSRARATPSPDCGRLLAALSDGPPRPLARAAAEAGTPPTALEATFEEVLLLSLRRFVTLSVGPAPTAPTGPATG